MWVTALSNVKPIEIVEIVAARFGIEPEALSGTVGRLSPESRARTLATFLLRKHTTATYSEVGALFGIPEESRPVMVRDMVNRGERWVEGEEPMTIMCELIERDIDRLHDGRPLPPPITPKRQKPPTCPQCGARRHLSQAGASA